MKEPVLFILLVFLSSGLAFGNQLSSTDHNASDICETHACVNAASRIIKMGNLSVDPCDDFYEFACGGFLNPTELTRESIQIDSFTGLRIRFDKKLQNILEQNITNDDFKYLKLAKTLYKQCADKKLDKLLNSMELNGGWPVLKGSQWNESAFDFNKTIFKVGNTTQWENYFFKLDNFDNFPLVTLEPYSSDISAEDLIQGRNNTKFNDYYNDMLKYAQAMNASDNNTNYIDDLDKIINFEIELAKLRLSEKQNLDPTFDIVNMTLYELEKNLSFFNWNEYINHYSLLPVASSEKVIIKNYSYMKKLQDLLNSSVTKKRTVANYVMWKHLRVNNKKVFELTINGCVQFVSSKLPIAVGAIFIQNYNHSKIVTAVDNISKMTIKIKEKFLEIIKQADWIDSETERNIIEKLQLSKNIIGLISELTNHSNINEIHKDLELNDCENILDSDKRIDLFNSKILFMPDIVYLFMWASHVIKSPAFYIFRMNSIILSYNMLEGEFFNPEQPNYINYGAIGLLIGHEITHGFDNTGKLYNANGQFNDTWTTNSTNNFHNKSNCIIEQYGNYTIKELGLNLDGYISQGETVADNGGVKAAYRAYNELSNTDKRLPGLFYTPKQMFWISYANTWCQKPTIELLKIHAVDVHPPQRFRVIGTLSNSPEFAKDFGCPSGSNMNPVKKCIVW